MTIICTRNLVKNVEVVVRNKVVYVTTSVITATINVKFFSFVSTSVPEMEGSSKVILKNRNILPCLFPLHVKA